MPRERTGSIRVRNGVPYARTTWVDENGKRHEKWKRADNRTHAKNLNKNMRRELDDHGSKMLASDRMKFKELAGWYRGTYLVPAQYVDGRKVAGQRSKSNRYNLKPLIEYFGEHRLRSITVGDVERFKAHRLATPIILKNKEGKTVKERQRAIASVNRELALLSRMLKTAKAEGWIIKNPFEAGGSLISLADEKKRERILTKEEEAKLLAACTGPRAHIRPILVLALDTGMRRGEIIKLTWGDLNFEDALIHVRAFNTKTMQERWLAMTDRVKFELSSFGALQKYPSSARLE